VTVCRFTTALQKVDAEIMKLQPGDAAGLRQLRWKRRLIVRQRRVVKAGGRKRDIRARLSAGFLQMQNASEPKEKIVQVPKTEQFSAPVLRKSVSK